MMITNLRTLNFNHILVVLVSLSIVIADTERNNCIHDCVKSNIIKQADKVSTSTCNLLCVTSN